MNSKLKLGERTNKCRKMRHNCERDGCFEKKYRCQLGKLDHLFPGKNGMTDIDGYCFVNGKKIFLEWKSGNGAVPERQITALKALSIDSLVLVAWGDPKEMLPDAFFAIQDREIGKIIKGETAPIEFDRTIKQWVNEKDISRRA